MSNAQHNVSIENRKKATFTGIEKVDTSNEKTIYVTSKLGRIIIEGSDLHIKKFTQDDGVLNIEGDIKALKYVDAGEKGGLAKKLFR